MANFFDKFPRIQYDIIRDGTTKRTTFTNLLVRVKVIEEIKNNVFAYYDYVVPEEYTMEILAEKYYGDSELHWVIALTNDIVDPHYDWPLRPLAFNNYIEGKYGSIATAQSQIVRYNKIITRTHISTNTKNIIKIEVTEDVFDALPETSLVTYNLSNNTSVEEVITKESIDAYTEELNLNENKRNIKLIKREYIHQIVNEFNNIMNIAGNNLINASRRTLSNR